jgi:hypothetical protein
MISGKIASIIGTAKDIARIAIDCKATLDRVQQAVARIELRQLRDLNIDSLRENEFQVSSQWGEDGIIQYLLQRVPIERKIFVEFGVGDYTESNTRFLLQNNNWVGLIIDGSPEHTTRIKKDPIYWRFNLKVECAFIDKESINQIITRAGISGDIGILSVDIDGNDYWVWQAIDCIGPRIVICEYNSIFGPIAKVTIPYDSSFMRSKAHYSNLYYGASLSGLHALARAKGYSLVGSNSAGNNVFFVRDDLVGGLRTYRPEEVYVQSQFRESLDSEGNLSYLGFSEGLKEVGEMSVYDLDFRKNIKIREISTPK